MDYTKLPRQLIYRDRRSIEDFGVYGDHKINKIIAKALRSFPFISGRNAEKNALTCMNNAYYICTMALLEKDPAWRISDYETISKNVDNNSKDEMGLVTLSLVYLYLCSLPKGVGSHLRDFLEEFKKSINHTGYLDTMTEGLDEDVELSSNEFAPRKIDNAAIEDLRQPHWNWTQYTDYYKSNIMDEVLKSLCKNELECLNIIKSFQRDAEDFYGTNDRYYNEIYERIAY